MLGVVARDDELHPALLQARPIRLDRLRPLPQHLAPGAFQAVNPADRGPDDALLGHNHALMRDRPLPDPAWHFLAPEGVAADGVHGHQLDKVPPANDGEVADALDPPDLIVLVAALEALKLRRRAGYEIPIPDVRPVEPV